MTGRHTLRRRLSSRLQASSRSGREYDVILFGVFGCGNFGNDATLDACMAALQHRLPRSRIGCIAADPTGVSTQHGIAAFYMTGGRGFGRVVGELGRLFYAWRVLRRTRTFVIAGTGVLDDQHVRPGTLPLDVLRWSLAGRLARARVIFLSVGAGPIEHVWSRRFLKTAVALAHEVSYRDRRSLEFMRGIGRDVSADRVLPDLALSLEPPLTARSSAPGVDSVAIGVVSQLNWLDRPSEYVRYERCIVDLAQRLVADGCEVTVVTGDEADIDTRDAIMRRPELAGLPVHAEECHSFDDVLQVAAQCDGMVASRYHNLVAAVLTGIPVLSLGYGPKNQALLEELREADWSYDIDAFDVGEVVSALRVAMTRRIPLFRTVLESYRRTLREEFDRLIPHD